MFAVVFSTTAAAETANKDLPDSLDVTKFLDKYKGESNYIEIVTETAEEDHPAWKWDVLECNGDDFVVFYSNSDNDKGYNAEYRDVDGEISVPVCGNGCTVKDKYKGENDEENEVEEDEETEEVEDTEDSGHAYEDLVNCLDAYTGKVTCSSRSCANNMCDYLKDNGWDAEVVKKAYKSVASGQTRFCIDVDTEDEGLMSIVLG